MEVFKGLEQGVVGALIAIVGVIGWLFKLEGKANHAKSMAANAVITHEKYTEKNDKRIAHLYDELIASDKRIIKQSILQERLLAEVSDLKDFIKGEGYKNMKEDLTKELVLELRKVANG